MRRPAMRNRGQGRPRRPTPLPSPPVRGGPKGPPVRAVPKTPPKPRPVRGGPKITEKPRVQKTPPKPRPTGRGLGGSTKGGPGPMTIARGGKSDIGTPRTQRPPKTNPYVRGTKGGKTPPNTGTSSKTAQARKTAQLQLDAVKAQRSNPPVNAQPSRTLQPAKNQPQVTAAEQKAMMDAAMRERAAAGKSSSGGQAKKVTPAELARMKAGNAARNKAPTGSRAAAMRRRRRRGGGGLAGALRRARSR